MSRRRALGERPSPASSEERALLPHARSPSSGHDQELDLRRLITSAACSQETSLSRSEGDIRRLFDRQAGQREVLGEIPRTGVVIYCECPEEEMGIIDYRFLR